MVNGAARQARQLIQRGAENTMWVSCRGEYRVETAETGIDDSRQWRWVSQWRHTAYGVSRGGPHGISVGTGHLAVNPA